MILNRLKKVQFDSGYYLKQKYDLTSDHFYSRLATALLGSGLLTKKTSRYKKWRIFMDFILYFAYFTYMDQINFKNYVQIHRICM